MNLLKFFLKINQLQYGLSDNEGDTEKIVVVLNNKNMKHD